MSVKLLDAVEDKLPGGIVLKAESFEVIVSVKRRSNTWIGLPLKEGEEARKFLVTHDNETLLRIPADESDVPAIAALVTAAAARRRKSEKDKGRKR